jgi:succinate-acetate transporter protein
MNNIEHISEKSNDESRQNMNINNNDETQLYQDLIKKLQNTTVIASGSDYFPNAIPLGAFCFAISFILYGFYECKVHKAEDKFLYIVIFLFGGIGQLTAGVFEFIKSRVYTATLYLMYSLYFLSFFFTKKYNVQNESLKIFFGSWACLTAPLIILSTRINLFYLIQNAAAVAFFIIKCIGVSKDNNALKGTISGILELVAGFCSLYICYGQIVNKQLKTQILPMIPLNKENEIDEINIKRE